MQRGNARNAFCAHFSVAEDQWLRSKIITEVEFVDDMLTMVLGFEVGVVSRARVRAV